MEFGFRVWGSLIVVFLCFEFSIPSFFLHFPVLPIALHRVLDLGSSWAVRKIFVATLLPTSRPLTTTHDDLEST